MSASMTVRPAIEPDRLLSSFCIACCLHAIILLLLPYFERTPAPPPMRVEIDLNPLIPDTKAPAPPLPEPPKPEPPRVEQPKPVSRPVLPQPAMRSPVVPQQALPVLTSRDHTPPAVEDAVASNVAAPAPASVVPSAPMTAAANERPVETTATTASTTGATLRNNEADADEAWQGYGQLLYDMVSKNKNYPQIAIRRHLQGKARVSARFSQGRLIELVLVEPGSGYQVLDSAALEMMKKAVNALPINGDLAKKSFTIVVPVEFKIDG
jgi:protein TonB